MHCIRVDYPTEWKTCNIYPLADLHLGDPHCDRQESEAQIRRVADDPHGLCICNGDLLNTALRHFVSDVYGETLKPMEQIVELVTLLEPIKDRIIGVTTGNHEWRTYRDDGLDIMRLVCRELGIEERYHPHGVLVFLRFGERNRHGYHANVRPRQLFTIYATHGAGGGRKEGAKAIRLADMAAIVDADIYVHSHSHLGLVMRETFFRVDTSNGCVRKADKLFVNTGATLDYGGYGQAKEYKPNSKRTPVIHLDAYKALATATL